MTRGKRLFGKISQKIQKRTRKQIQRKSLIAADLVKDSIESIDNFYNELELSEVISNNNIIKILSLSPGIIVE